MKARYTLFILASVAALALFSCTVKTDNVDGHLEGMWHLVSIETLGADTTRQNATTDLSQQYLFWSFQAKLLELDDKTGSHPSYLLRFDISGNSITLSDPYLYNREEGDVKLDDATPLQLYGISSLSEHFTFSVSGSSLIMESTTHRLKFKKF